MDEFDFIATLLRPLAAPEALGLRDDAALLKIPPGKTLVVTKDAISAGVHFIGDEPAGLIARKLLRMNLSDLAAMGADPYGYFLALMLPTHASKAWLRDFSEGLRTDQHSYGMALMGGDTTATLGILGLSATFLGTVPDGMALTRSGARPGDALYVSGTLGDGALGLKITQNDPVFASLPEPHRAFLLTRYRLPEPRLKLGSALRGIATACMDISDGLMQDLGHLAEASGVGAIVGAAALPFSPAAQAAFACLPSAKKLAGNGGDDYELLFTVPPEKESLLPALGQSLGITLTRIGTMTQEKGQVQCKGADGEIVLAQTQGYRHQF